MRKACKWMTGVLVLCCMLSFVAVACAKTTYLMDAELFSYVVPTGLAIEDAAFKQDGLLSLPINDDATDWGSAIACTGENNVSILIALKAPDGVEPGDWLMLKSGKNEAEALRFIEEAENEPQFNDFWKVTSVDENRNVQVQRQGSPDLDFGIMVGEYLSGVEYMVPLTYDEVYIAGWYDSSQQLKQALGYQKLVLQFTHSKKSAFHVKGPQKTPASRIVANASNNQNISYTVTDGVITYVFDGKDISLAEVATAVKAPKGATSYSWGNMKASGSSSLHEGGYTDLVFMSLNSSERAKSSDAAISFFKWNEEKQQDELLETTQLQINFETADNLPWTYYEYVDGKGISPVPEHRLIVENSAAKAGYDYRYDPTTGHLNTFYRESSSANSESAQGDFFYSVEPYQEMDEMGRVIREAKYFKYGAQGRTYGLLGKGANGIEGFSIEAYGWGSHPAESIDSYLPCEGYEAFRKIKPNDNKIAIYYPGRFLPKYSINLMIIYWYENQNDTEPMHIEYLWESTTPFAAVKYYRPVSSEKDMPKPVDRPYVLGVDENQHDNWKLVVTTYYQEADHAQHYELRMEDRDGNPIEITESVTIYLPYPEGCNANSFCTLRHYSSELYSETSPKLNGVPITVAPTEYGLKFETLTFCPFILSWESNAEEGGAAAVPKTGDPMQLWLTTALLLLSASLFVCVRRRLLTK